MKNIRKPAVAGSFYSADPHRLNEEIDHFFSRTINNEAIKNVRGLVAPHAGYMFSGLTAAYSYNTVTDRDFKTVIIISPSHTIYFHGISVFSGDAYESPFGVVPVNKEIAHQLCDYDEQIKMNDTGHAKEHAIEVQLPFLQKKIKNFSIVPIIMGDQSQAYIDLLADALRSALDDSILLVASSDLSHYHSHTAADKMDGKLAEYIARYDPDGLARALENGEVEACGGGAIVAMMKALEPKENRACSILHRCDSSAVWEDKERVVGYLAAGIHQ